VRIPDSTSSTEVADLTLFLTGSPPKKTKTIHFLLLPQNKLDIKHMAIRKNEKTFKKLFKKRRF
jgi:hypothetical protein